MAIVYFARGNLRVVVLNLELEVFKPLLSYFSQNYLDSCRSTLLDLDEDEASVKDIRLGVAETW